MRTGKPCSSGSGSPFMPTAMRASRFSSVSAPSGVPMVMLSALVVLTASAPSWTPARASRSRTGMPSQAALPTYGPPTSFDTQVRVMRLSTRRSLSRSRKLSSSSWSTMPWMRSVYPSTGTFGTLSAVSTR